MQKLLLVILTAMLATLVIVLILLNPNSLNSTYFWWHVIWIAFLITINWLVAIVFFSDSNSSSAQNKSLMGVLPSISLAIFIYSIVSLLLIGLNLISDIFFDASQQKNYHLVAQIVIASCLLILCITLIIISKITGPQIDNFFDKEQILQILKVLKLEQTSSNSALLDKVINQIKYQLPHSKNIKETQYTDLLEHIERLKSVSSAGEAKECIEAAYLSTKKIS